MALMKKRLVIGGTIVLAAVLIIIIVVATVNRGDHWTSESSYYTSCAAPKSKSFSSYQKAAISTDAKPCATIAKQILLNGSTTVEAAIAALFCVGIINSQSCGIGGGFLATIYSKSEGKVYTLDAREVAPLAASPYMYIRSDAKKGSNWWDEKPSLSMKGGLSVGVPGEVPGLYALYEKFGGITPWKDLIEPSIKIAEQGYNLTWYTGGITQLSEADILREPSMSMYMNQEENRVLREGEIVRRLKLSETLRMIQKDPMALQRGDLAEKFAQDIQSVGGIITSEDLAQYKPQWKEPVKFHLQNGNMSLYSFPPPGSGLLVGLILNIMDEYNLTSQDASPARMDKTQQLVAEAMKFAFARRKLLGDLSPSEIATVSEKLTSDNLAVRIKGKLLLESTNQDPMYYGGDLTGSDDQGTAHISLIGPDGDAVAITSSINYAYGAGIRSEQTGIILNNQMNDFSQPDPDPSVPLGNNAVQPGKRPLSSMSPSIVVDKNGDVRMAIGAGGGKQIVTAVSWVMIRNLWLGENLQKAVESCRSHHQLDPMILQYETGFPENWLTSLESKGHFTNELNWKSVVASVAASQSGLDATVDFRKSGEINGF